MSSSTNFSHGMILSCQSPIFRRTVKIESTVKCRWHSQVVKSLLLFMYGMPSELDNSNSTVELLLCATYYQVNCFKQANRTLFQRLSGFAKSWLSCWKATCRQNRRQFTTRRSSLYRIDFACCCKTWTSRIALRTMLLSVRSSTFAASR